jgi:IS30 family transposase
MEDEAAIGARRPTGRPGNQHAVRSPVCSLGTDRQRIVAGKLKQDWSPQQIAGRFKDQYPGDPEMWVSHEAIYRRRAPPG